MAWWGIADKTVEQVQGFGKIGPLRPFAEVVGRVFWGALGHGATILMPASCRENVMTT